MVASSQIPHQPYKDKLFHHLLSHESGNLKTKIKQLWPEESFSGQKEIYQFLSETLMSNQYWCFINENIPICLTHSLRFFYLIIIRCEKGKERERRSHTDNPHWKCSLYINKGLPLTSTSAKNKLPQPNNYLKIHLSHSSTLPHPQ